MKELTFSVKSKSRPVVIEDDPTGVIKYELREMKASIRDKYMDRLSKRLALDAKGNVIGIKSYEGMQIDLLTQCMFTESGNAVDRVTLEKWPASIVGALFTAAQELNLFRAPSARNSILAEQVSQWLKDHGHATVDSADIEAVIEDTERKLFATQDGEDAKS